MEEVINGLKRVAYDRKAAVEYARKWAYGRNPAYYDFSRLGGDCTNFASQCVYAGSDVMNYTPVVGWYYIGADNRTASNISIAFSRTTKARVRLRKKCLWESSKSGIWCNSGERRGIFITRPWCAAFRAANRS